MMAPGHKRWLSLIGVGEDGLDGLSPAARNLIAQAQLVVGGARHLALVGDLAHKTLVWPTPITDALPVITAQKGQSVVVLATGDPFFYGIGTMLARAIPMDEILCLPHSSAFSLAAARLGWSLQDCAIVSLHGRALANILPHLKPRARVLALSWDGETPGQIARDLTQRGMGRSRITALAAMGGPREARREGLACDWSAEKIDPLNIVAIEVILDQGARKNPYTPGLPDDWFEHDGQITKRDVRAITLSALAPTGDEILWDIGAGSGSISIEWMLAAPRNRAFAIESHPERAQRIARNALALGVPALKTIMGRAPDALDGLPAPDAIFIGGGATAPGLIAQAMAALSPDGRLIVNGVTLETQAILARHYGAEGGELLQIQVAQAVPVGRFSGFRPSMPVVQWRWRKSCA